MADDTPTYGADTAEQDEEDARKRELLYGLFWGKYSQDELNGLDARLSLPSSSPRALSNEDYDRMLANIKRLVEQDKSADKALAEYKARGNKPAKAGGGGTDDDALRIADRYLDPDGQSVTTADANAYTASHPDTMSDVLARIKRENPDIPEVGEAGIRGMMPGWPGWAQTAGEYAGKAMNAIPPEVALAANFLSPSIKAPVRVANPIKAYHGSPHDFDAFDLSKIGTGEGAQAYGHGLYFAESEPVARSYRNQLSKTNVLVDDKPVTSGSIGNKWLEDELGSGYFTGMDQLDKVYAPYSLSPVVQDAMKRLRELDAAGRLKFDTSGRMYEVNLHATPEQFLDWDKPLSGQSSAVQDALAPFGLRTNPQGMKSFDDALLAALEGNSYAPLPKQPSDPRGEDIIHRLYRQHGSSWLEPNKSGQGAVAEKLNEAGIPGIRYLDQGSRGKGEGTSNYVVWSPEIIELVRKYGLAGLSMLPPAVAASLRHGDQDDEALRIADKYAKD